METNRLHHWIVVLHCAYMEYTYTPWDGRNYYRLLPTHRRLRPRCLVLTDTSERLTPRIKN